MTQVMSVWLLPKYRPIDGSAMFTMVESSAITSWAPAMSSSSTVLFADRRAAVDAPAVSPGSVLMSVMVLLRFARARRVHRSVYLPWEKVYRSVYFPQGDP